ncbi:MAG: M6 family metalloprotease domain-containing protein, partial [Bacteroidales bacterium]|nr:M6 family metalloprotease domain-containing protein [Bacteroidales bacterium]
MKITDTNTNQTSVTMKASQTHLSLKKIIIWIALQLFFVIGLQAAWIEKLPTVVKDPDGMELKIFSTGDEYFSFLHDENDYTIIQGNDGYYYYAIQQGENIIASNYRVRNTNPFLTNIQAGVRISSEEYKSRRDAFWKDAPENTSKSVHEGTMVNLVVYIRFADDTEYVLPRSTYDARFNGSDQQSIKDYFQEVSYNNLTIQSYHYPESEMSVNISYQDQYTRDYYRPYNETTNPIGYQGGNSGSQRIDREHTLLQNAVNAISSAIPSNLVIDANNDGKVDNVCFIIRGNAEGWADLLWAHRWVLYSKTVNINGKRVYDYTFQPENQTTVKTLAHEMFHTLGAPDLYHYSYDGLNPAGDWDLMQSGFGHMGAYMKWKYAGQKWVTSIPVISAPGTYTLNPISSSSQNAFRINSPNSSTEYFVVE